MLTVNEPSAVVGTSGAPQVLVNIRGAGFSNLYQEMNPKMTNTATR